MLAKAATWLGVYDEGAFITFRHLRRTNLSYNRVHAKGGATFCFLVEPNNGVFHFSVALCSNKDIFNKERGRQIAFGRMTLNHTHFLGEFSGEDSMLEQALSVLEDSNNPLALKLHRDHEKYGLY